MEGYSSILRSLSLYNHPTTHLVRKLDRTVAGNIKTMSLEMII